MKKIVLIACKSLGIVAYESVYDVKLVYEMQLVCETSTFNILFCQLYVNVQVF